MSTSLLLSSATKSSWVKPQVSSQVFQPQTQAVIDALTPQEGQVVFNSDVGALQMYNGSVWESIGLSGESFYSASGTGSSQVIEDSSVATVTFANEIASQGDDIEYAAGVFSLGTGKYQITVNLDLTMESWGGGLCAVSLRNPQTEAYYLTKRVALGTGTIISPSIGYTLIADEATFMDVYIQNSTSGDITVSQSSDVTTITITKIG